MGEVETTPNSATSKRALGRILPEALREPFQLLGAIGLVVAFICAPLALIATQASAGIVQTILATISAILPLTYLLMCYVLITKHREKLTGNSDFGALIAKRLKGEEEIDERLRAMEETLTTFTDRQTTFLADVTRRLDEYGKKHAVKSPQAMASLSELDSDHMLDDLKIARTEKYDVFIPTDAPNFFAILRALHENEITVTEFTENLHWQSSLTVISFGQLVSAKFLLRILRVLEPFGLDGLKYVKGTKANDSVLLQPCIPSETYADITEDLFTELEQMGDMAAWSAVAARVYHHT